VYQKCGVSIGDVGSITPEAEHPVNANDTPADFSPMSPYGSKDVVQLHYDPGEHVSTSTIRRLDLDAPSE
jgi:hypothetical protein